MHRKVPEEDPRARRIKVLLSLGVLVSSLPEVHGVEK